jgi:hypothetical protein
MKVDILFTRYSKTSSIDSVIFRVNAEFVEVLQSGCVNLCYITDAQLFVQPRLVPHRKYMVFALCARFSTVSSVSALFIENRIVNHSHTKDIMSSSSSSSSSSS